MKLFENGVGRPSNEIKKKRKIFIASIIVLCIALVSVIAFTLTKVNTNRLQGVVTMNSIKPDYRATVKDISCGYNNARDTLTCTYYWNFNYYKIHKLKVDSKITKVGSASYSNGYQGRNPRSEIVNNFNDSLTIAIDDGYSKNKDIEITLHAKAYNSSANLLYEFDYVHIVKMGDQKVKGNPNGSIKNVIITKADIKETPATNNSTCNNNVKLELNCPKSAKINQAFQCTSNKNLAGVTISATKGEGFSGNKISWTTTKNDNAKDLKYSSTGVKTITATYCNGKKKATAYVTIESNPSVNNSNNSNNSPIRATTTKSTAKKTTKAVKLNLTCPSSVQAEEVFTCTTTIAGATISGPKTNLASGYKNSVNEKSNKFKYTKAGKTVTISVSKKGSKTITKKVKIVKKISVNDLKYVVPKVFKVDANGTKTIEINPYRLGFDVKYYQFVVCKDRDACLNYTTPNENAKASGLISIDKIKENVKIKFSSNNKALLGSDFYIRAITYDNYGKEIYYKVHRFFVNPVTNNKVSNEANVKNDDYAGTTHDFLYSSNLTVDLKDHEHFYEISSIEKIKTSTADKMVNINLENSGKNVKYVRFAVCSSYSDCKKDDIFDLIASDSKIGTASELLEAKPGQGVSLSLFTGDDDLLKTSIYSVVFTYDENKNLLFKKIHKFTTSSKTKLGVEKEASIRVGDRVSTKHKRLSSKIYSQEN